MTKFSQSPHRMTFQKEGYVNRQKEKGEEVNDEYLNYFEQAIKQHAHRFDNPESRKYNLEWDLLTTDWILEKVRASKSYAQNLYAAMCNNSFTKREMWPILKEEKWSCSWRYAGGIIADMRQEGDYIDWYCGGIRDTEEPSEEEWNSWTSEQQINWTNVYSNYVIEETVTEEIENDLYKLGWLVVKDNNE